jgi:hypothetical protein
LCPTPPGSWRAIVLDIIGASDLLIFMFSSEPELALLMRNSPSKLFYVTRLITGYSLVFPLYLSSPYNITHNVEIGAILQSSF